MPRSSAASAEVAGGGLLIALWRRPLAERGTGARRRVGHPQILDNGSVAAPGRTWGTLQAQGASAGEARVAFRDARVLPLG